MSQQQRSQIVGDLMPDDAWKNVMGSIPSWRYPGMMRFNHQQIENLTVGAREKGKQPMEVLLDEWGTMPMGKNMLPTVEQLISICLEVEQISAASNMSENILGKGPIKEDSVEEAKIEYRFTMGDPPMAFDQEDTDFEDGILPDSMNSDFIGHPSPGDAGMAAHQVRYDYLYLITEGFESGNLIGRGGFAEVFKGVTLRRKVALAIKVLKNVGTSDSEEAKFIERQFNYEIDQLPRLQHENIIELYGYSNDKKKKCLVFPFMQNGTLYARLEESRKTPVGEADKLLAPGRIAILKGICAGIKFLHSVMEGTKCLVHKDIKPSNILLDEWFMPKICDFGLLRLGTSGTTEDETKTVNVYASKYYAPPEGTQIITALYDVFSFGVVMVEVLTNLKNPNEDNESIYTYIQSLEKDFDVSTLLVQSANWDKKIGNELLRIAIDHCLQRKHSRSTSEDVYALICKVSDEK